MYNNNMRPGLGMAIVMLIVYYLFFLKNKLVISNKVDAIVLIYVLYAAVSFLWFFFSGMPVSVFIREFSNSILPIGFYFIAKSEVNYNYNDKFYSNSLNVIIISFLIGFVLHLQMPVFYLKYMSLIEAVDGKGMAFIRQYYGSIWGLTVTGSLGVVGLLISFKQIKEKNSKVAVFTLIICALGLIMTYRRSAIIIGLMAIIMVHILGLLKYKIIKPRFILAEILLSTIIINWTFDNVPFYFEDLYERATSVSVAFDERSYTWFMGLETVNNIIAGDGLGTYGHKALAYSQNIIPDGNYFKILGELGILGISLFISIIIISILKGSTNLKILWAEVGIITALSLQAIGSNIYSFQQLMPLFWFSIGRCNSKHKKLGSFPNK